MGEGKVAVPSQSTISEILSKKDNFLAMTDEELNGKRKRPCAHPDTEKALAQFVNEMESKGAPINRESLCNQAIPIGNALKIINFEFSNGWMSNFEKRFSFKSRIIHGEAESAVTIPRRTISKTPLSGQKDDKTRITIALACNADVSHKYKLFFIGHAAKRRCFGEKTGDYTIFI
ncbi:hypothetical protein INT45_012458 [Circinella minor]|uniref:HTH CENPB-type domain-containing protein n=1 Tax=Circinella minor TaxID=1195481 RepID=A0A8H7S167_9FUNG|nr:hypothetical protein INT45_012458 [Circinella minor]